MTSLRSEMEAISQITDPKRRVAIELSPAEATYLVNCMVIFGQAYQLAEAMKDVEARNKQLQERLAPVPSVQKSSSNG